AVIFPQAAISQENPLERRVSGSYSNESLDVILRHLDEVGHISIYFVQDKLPDTRGTFEFQQITLGQALEQLLEGTDLGFVPYRSYGVVLMPRRMIGEIFSANYYQVLEESVTPDHDELQVSQEIVIGAIESLDASGNAVLTGEIVDQESNEPVIGSSVLLTGTGIGTVTDENGRFELEVPIGKHEVVVEYIGYRDAIRQINVYSNGSLDVILEKTAIDLDEVTVSAQAADAQIENVQVGVTTLDVKNIKKIPAFLGEADVVRNLLLHPGVSSLGEGSTGFNVRGGDVDQNLILQDEGVFFNSSHALGFFSIFNSDLINRVDLYKGNIPASFGGRLSSAMDVEMRDGDFERFRLKGGIGPVSSKISLEGPIVDEKVSFLAGVRSSYSDWILKQFNVRELDKSSAFFYDANARLTIKANERNTLILSAYGSEDEFIYNDEFGFDYATLMGQLIYKKLFSDKAFSKLSVTASSYESAQSDLEGIDAARLDNSIRYLKFKEHLTFTPSSQVKIEGGLSSIFYLVEPGKRSPFDENSEVITKELEKERGLESSIFLNLEYSLTSAFLISVGIRGTLYQFLGPKTVFDYQNPDLPRSDEIIGATEFGNGNSIASYQSLEPRVSMRYRFDQENSIKFGYSRTSQFINQIFNTDSPTPSNQWQLSSKYIKPQRAHNVSAGFFRNIDDNLWETSIELYARYIDHLFDYRDFAELNANEHLETELRDGIGRTYGAEISIKKKSGILNGWFSYTLSRSERKIDEINSADWYPSNFDKTHDLSLVMNYQPNRRNTLTINFNYSTGRPSTPPIGNYQTGTGLVIPVYSDRNQFRIPDYHRMDLAYTLGKGYKKDKRIQTSWTISIYNVYGRKNAFSVFFTQAAFQQAQANKLAVVGTAIPSLTLNFEIL
ncbi:MAG: TonB-dependent receptor, partial [Saprospiraceae bacterium]|nr:TonB-dependent receptor [Saprospiraceae bacterium]